MHLSKLVIWGSSWNPRWGEGRTPTSANDVESIGVQQQLNMANAMPAGSANDIYIYIYI